jgi:hypothetical protein
VLKCQQLCTHTKHPHTRTPAGLLHRILLCQQMHRHNEIVVIEFCWVTSVIVHVAPPCSLCMCLCVCVYVCLGMTILFCTSHLSSTFIFFHFCIRIFTPVFGFYILIHLSFPFIDFICRRFKLCAAFAKILFQSAHKERKNQESALLYEDVLLHLFRKHSMQDFQKTNKT